MYQDIVVPTDGSGPSERAVAHAIDLATRYDARLHALYVVDVDALGPVDFDASRIVGGLEAEGDAVTDRVVDAAEAAGVRVRKAIVDGSPAEAIVDYVAAEGADLVVMGTHGRRGLDRFLLGSVTERVLRTAPVPVLVVRVAESTDEGAEAAATEATEPTDEPPA
ncbi:universal stress protein [Halobium salinum]|uniref:Universal stress protein n=1 Tax=Halobium salinum TaxID=1364940 RepID=A0ABD5PG91_9EURY|nr:universal stress protein [Halobium salinum]